MQDAFIVSFFLISIFLILALMLWLGWVTEERRGDVSPYAKVKMRLGIDVARSIQEYINGFLADELKPDNPAIDFTQAAICNETGRIFTNCVNNKGYITLDWSFIQKRLPGTYVSWGALSENEKAIVKLLHGSLDGFQTEQSCPKIRPQDIDREYALLSPGPLYIDRRTKILIGWKKIPGTYFEALIVQRPIYQSIDDTL